MATLQETADEVGKDWVQSPYYQKAETQITVFWRKQTLFWRLFDQLDLAHLVELACGHGRHTEITKALAGKVMLLDILDENIEVCRRRFKSFPHVECARNNGINFHPVTDGDASAIFCYDAMVHFPSEVVASYLADARRVLRQGGLALFHHSNYGVTSEQHYGRSPGARNFMTQELFTRMAEEAGLRVLESHVINWGGVENLDCLTLLKK